MGGGGGWVAGAVGGGGGWASQKQALPAIGPQTVLVAAFLIGNRDVHKP